MIIECEEFFIAALDILMFVNVTLILTDPVDERQTLAERNLRLQDQLRSLKEDLSHIRDDTGETTMDRIHKENVKQGRDKYKTLREVRKGNTKRRVDQFENM